jgi:hypothetical protein
MNKFCLYSEIIENDGYISLTYLWSSNKLEILIQDVENLKAVTPLRKISKEHFVITVGRSEYEYLKTKI